MIKRICIFGASIAFGSGDYKFGGWQNYLKVWFAKRGEYQHVFNLAVSGRTTGDIIKRFKNELSSRRSDSNPENEILALISVPINDSRFVIIDKKVRQEVSQKTFLENLKKLKKLSDEYADKVVFISMSKVVDTKTNPWYKEKSGVSWKNSTIKKYNKIAQEFCQKEKIPFIDVFNVLNDKDLDDGLHPSAEGHRKMFEKIKSFLEKEKIV